MSCYAIAIKVNFCPDSLEFKADLIRVDSEEKGKMDLDKLISKLRIPHQGNIIFIIRFFLLSFKLIRTTGKSHNASSQFFKSLYTLFSFFSFSWYFRGTKNSKQEKFDKTWFLSEWEQPFPGLKMAAISCSSNQCWLLHGRTQ